MTDRALRGNGETAPNPADEIVRFDTVVLSMRYGLTRHINILANIPYLRIQSDKVQGAPYSRLNTGFGDLLVSAEYRIGTSPQFTLEAGVKLATANVDETDEFDQRICDILALGSGTNDLVLGFGVWIPNFVIRKLDLTAGARYRFAGGENKWGYQFGDQVTFSVHGSRPATERLRFGLRMEGYHTQPDTWYGNVVPERGATMVYLGPTMAVNLSELFAVGAYARFPIVMQLEGSQMVAPYAVGIEFTTDLGSLLGRLVPGKGGE